MKRIFKYIGVGFLAVIVAAYIFLEVSPWILPEMYGSYDLGNGIYMMEWDGGGRIIVKGSTIRGRTCYGGAQLIPTYENSYDSGHFAEYVIDATSDADWIIARTGNHISGQRKYYIVRKKNLSEDMSALEILDKLIESFSDSIQFSQKCLDYSISLNWNHTP